MFSQITDFLIYRILLFEENSKFAEVLHSFLHDTLDMFFLTFITIYVISLFKCYNNRYKVEKFLSHKSPAISYALAILIGLITPSCCCSGIPLFIGFLVSEISLDVAIVFLISSPLINGIVITLLISKMGLQYTAIYITSSILISVCGGLLFKIFKMEKWVNKETLDIGHCYHHNTKKDLSLSNYSTIRSTLYYLKVAYSNAVSMLQKIWFFIVIGALCGSLLQIHNTTLNEALIIANTNQLLGIPIVVLIGFLFHGNIVSLIPVISQIISYNYKLTAILVPFMMSFMSVSVPQLIILYKLLKLPILVCFTVFLIVAFILIGYFLNFI